MNKEDFTKVVLNPLFVSFNKPKDEAQFSKEYYEVLSKYDETSLRKAVYKAKTDLKFMPKIAELLGFLTPQTTNTYFDGKEGVKIQGLYRLMNSTRGQEALKEGWGICLWDFVDGLNPPFEGQFKLPQEKDYPECKQHAQINKRRGMELEQDRFDGKDLDLHTAEQARLIAEVFVNRERQMKEKFLRG